MKSRRKFRFCFALSFLISEIIVTAALPSEFLWVRPIPAPGPTANDYAVVYAVALTSRREPIVLGERFWWNGQPLGQRTNFGLFLRKYDQSGALLWEHNETNATARHLATDGADNIYLGGFINGPIQFADTSRTNDSGGVVIKCDSAGMPQWARACPPLSAMAIDQMTNILLCGEFRGQLDFGTTNLSSATDDIWMAKLSPDGTTLWARYAVSGNDYFKAPFGITTDPGGDIFVAGTFEANVAFGPTNLTTIGSDDIFVARYNSAGDLIWVRQIGSTWQDSTRGIQLDALTNVYISGTFSRPCNFGSTNLSTTGFALFLAKYDGAGTLAWARKVDRRDYVPDQNFAVAPDGTAFLTASFGDVANFGVTNLTTDSVASAFVAQYDTDGALVSALRLKNVSVESRRQFIATDTLGRVFLGGTILTESTFGGFTLTNNARAGFICKIGPRPSLQITPAASGALLSWSQAAEGFAIEHSPSLLAPTWMTLGNNTVTNSSPLLVPNTDETQFFRLRSF